MRRIYHIRILFKFQTEKIANCNYYRQSHNISQRFSGIHFIVSAFIIADAYFTARSPGNLSIFPFYLGDKTI